MMQVHRDMVCVECNSVNQHEKVTRVTNNNVIEMVLKCKACGHEYLTGTMTSTSDDGHPVVFNITNWESSQIELY
jgi:uncharacterized Zn finger protein